MSLGFVWFARVRPCGRWVRLGSSGSFGGVLGSFGFVFFVRERPWGRWDRSGSSSLVGCALRVAGFVFFVWMRLKVAGFIRMGLLRPVAA